jgi:hypothetical protein
MVLIYLASCRIDGGSSREQWAQAMARTHLKVAVLGKTWVRKGYKGKG